MTLRNGEAHVAEGRWLRCRWLADRYVPWLVMPHAYPCRSVSLLLSRVSAISPWLLIPLPFQHGPRRLGNGIERVAQDRMTRDEGGFWHRHHSEARGGIEVAGCGPPLRSLPFAFPREWPCQVPLAGNDVPADQLCAVIKPRIHDRSRRVIDGIDGVVEG